MKKIFFILAVSFAVLILINIVWIGYNVALWAKDGIQSLLLGRNLFESISDSVYMKWIFLADAIWIVFALIFMLQRKHYKTDPRLHYLHYDPITNPTICVIIPAYNEEISIEKVVRSFINQKFVESVIVIDNKSIDNTINIAEKCGAKVIRKEKNRGLGHSYAIGLKMALETNVNVIATTDADGTSNAYDLEKLLPYLDNSDIVIGSRQVQVLTEKGNQNSIMHVWGNHLLAKLIQLKYFSLHHLGIVSLTDVGCLFRLIRQESLEKLVEGLTEPKTGEAIGGMAFALHLTMLGIENDLRIIEIPITFNKRIGKSKTRSDENLIGIKIGLKFLWFILIH